MGEGEKRRRGVEGDEERAGRTIGSGAGGKGGGRGIEQEEKTDEVSGPLDW